MYAKTYLYFCNEQIINVSQHDTLILLLIAILFIYLCIYSLLLIVKILNFLLISRHLFGLHIHYFGIKLCSFLLYYYMIQHTSSSVRLAQCGCKQSVLTQFHQA